MNMIAEKLIVDTKDLKQVNPLLYHIELAQNIDVTKPDHKSTKIECIRCGSVMGEITVCHLKCLNCGSELTCSDKGNFW
jgi:hypothetical protein